ncbi:hypothetical protein [Streptomyces noursei]
MTRRLPTLADAQEAAHALSHQPWMPPCSWEVIERTDGSAYVRAEMHPDIPHDEGLEFAETLRRRLGGSCAGWKPRAWCGKWGHISVTVVVPQRADTATAVEAPRPRTALSRPGRFSCTAELTIAELRQWAAPAAAGVHTDGYAEAMRHVLAILDRPQVPSSGKEKTKR